MNTKPEALRLADWLDGHSNGPMDAKHKAADELRRLHQITERDTALLQQALEALECALSDEPYFVKVGRATIVWRERLGEKT